MGIAKAGLSRVLGVVSTKGFWVIVLFALLTLSFTLFIWVLMTF